MSEEFSSSSNEKLIETELLRKRIYEQEFIEWAKKEIPELKYKEICHLLLRYLFNKIITKTEKLRPDSSDLDTPTFEKEDPIFISTRSPLAEEQLKKDLEYHKINTKDPQKIIDELEKKFLQSSKIMMNENVRSDRKISLSQQGKIVYGNQEYNDISNLAKNNPSKIKYALALNIRYNYLKLTNHGLARVYKEMAKPSEGCEAFASAFNHYFDSFCSAFPDLEVPFGSRGSFFSQKEWPISKIYMNPPFDESLMTHAMERVVSYCESIPKLEFLCTFPNWNNFPGLDIFRTCKWMKKVNEYEKGKIPFIDYMNNGRIIYPCGIIEVIVSSSEKLESSEEEVNHPKNVKNKKHTVEIVFEDDDDC